MKNQINISILILWFNQLFGLIGLIFIDFNLFSSLSPYSLLLTFFMVISINTNISLKNFSYLFLIMIVSMGAEIIGVNYGIFFGSYYYGENLGAKVFGVPIIIGLNWVFLTVSCGNISYYFFKNKLIYSIFFGSFLMLLFDVSIEPLSDSLDFWFFNDENLFYNYITWFILGLLNQYIYLKFNSRKNILFSFHTYFSILLFFIILNISF